MSTTRSFRCSNCDINWPLSVNKTCECCGGEVWANDDPPITYQEMLDQRDITARRRKDFESKEAERLRRKARFEEFYARRAVRELRQELEDWDTAKQSLLRLAGPSKEVSNGEPFP